MCLQLLCKISMYLSYCLMYSAMGDPAGMGRDAPTWRNDVMSVLLFRCMLQLVAVIQLWYAFHFHSHTEQMSMWIVNAFCWVMTIY